MYSMLFYRVISLKRYIWNYIRDFVIRGRINIVNLLSHSMDLNNHQDNGMSSGQGLSIIPTIHKVT